MNRNILIALIYMNIIGCTSYKPYKSMDLLTETNNQLQIVLDKAVNEFKLPGLQAGIIFPDGKIILASSGTVDFKRKEGAITNKNIFRIGSTTKMFIAALIGRLMEKGQLSYNETIDKWFPDLPFAKTITVKELLNQNSGIKENLFTNPMILMKSILSDKKNWEAQTVVNRIMKNTKVAPAEQRSFVYANNNYLLLGLIAEKVGNDNIANQLENEFFKPLNMSNTYFLPYYTDIPKGLINGYDEYIPFGPHIIKPSNISWSTLTFSAGSMASTSEDLLIWLNAFFHNKVLKPETINNNRTYIDARNNGCDNNIVGYGLGVAQYELNGYIMEGHPGGGFGGECFPFYIPQIDASIVILYNWSKKDNPAGKILIKRIIEQVLNNTK